jgi:hypothetical protein
MEKCIKCGKEHDGSFGSGKYCSRSCANSRTWSYDDKIKKSEANKGISPWNKDTKGYRTAERIKVKCKYCRSDIEQTKTRNQKYHADCWLKSSGGYRKGSGIGKSGWYKGYWCDSSYELAWVIYQLDHNKKFERNTKKYPYTYKNKKYYYIPDFIQGDSIIEIKGYTTEKVLAKLEAVPNLVVLYKKDLKHIFKYVEKKYGKDYVKLYGC